MAKIQLTIDDKKIQAEEGISIMETAREAGIDIPHLCYMENLPAAASCRLCVVEVAGARNLPASCATPVAAGMVVKTASERVIRARRQIIELILSDHPLDCMTCEKSGKCDLEKYAYELGVTGSGYDGEKHAYPIDTTNPFFIRDYNKCILCGRCVAACGQIQFVEAISFANRGFDCKIATAYDRSLKDSPCVYCGQCVDACPTGALVEKSRFGAGRTWEIKKTPTICSYCGVGCNIELHTKNERIVNVTAALENEVNRGRLCVKGKFGWDYVHSPERLDTPLIRTGQKGEGKFRPASWEEALSLVAEKFSDIKTTNGPDSLAVLSSAKCTNEENYLLQKFARAVIGTNNIDHCARL
jgi:predicted molibdopterin-dependent oxidoreductase YjgC